MISTQPNVNAERESEPSWQGLDDAGVVDHTARRVQRTASGERGALRLHYADPHHRLEVDNRRRLDWRGRSERDGLWECTVPTGQYLMLGDNRDNSADSRVWGFLPHEQVYGKAVRVLINFSDLKRAWTPL